MNSVSKFSRFACASALATGILASAAATASEVPQVSVRFAHFPYFDHTQSIIGLEKGWFAEAGISFDPEPHGIVVQASEAAAVLASGRVDVMSASAQLFLPAAKTLPPNKVFFYADIFQGYAIMAQRDGGSKSFQEFLADGMSPDDAFLATMGQMKGMRFAFPTEAAIKGFIDLAITKGGMTLADVDAVGAPDDSANVALMEAGRADFQVGGVPSRMTLQIAGFKPILTSGDLAAYAGPSADSIELRAVFHDGWVATDEWIEANYDTVLRLAGVGFRINQYINDHPDMAAAIHTPFLNSVAGTTFARRASPTSPTPRLTRSGRLTTQTGWIIDKVESAERRVRDRFSDQDLRGAGPVLGGRVHMGQSSPLRTRSTMTCLTTRTGQRGSLRNWRAWNSMATPLRCSTRPRPSMRHSTSSTRFASPKRPREDELDIQPDAETLNALCRKFASGIRSGAYLWYALGILIAFAVWEAAASALGQYRLPSSALIAPKFFLSC